MNKKLFLALVVLFASSSRMWAADGDTFKANTAEGVEMEFKVISESEKTCQVGDGLFSGSSIPDKTTGTITIPSQVNGYQITTIGDYAFSYCEGLTSITIPEGVNSIGQSAFKDCSGLTSITIPEGVKSIGLSAFKDCSGLTSITIPQSVKSIDGFVFAGCKLLSIVVEPGNTVYDSRNNCNAIIKTASNELISGCKNTIIPNSVTSIGFSAFDGCSELTSITIPNSVTKIDLSAFSGCTSLTSITLPESVVSIGNSAFEECSSLTSITLPESIVSIGESAFCYCENLTNITIPNSVTTIGKSAFLECSSLTCITIPEGVKAIESYTFAYCRGLTSITIPNSVTTIGKGAFGGCGNLASIKIPEGVKSIDDETFAYCRGLTSINIPNSVTSIGKSAFYGCDGLVSLTIPENVTSIGSYAFVCSLNKVIALNNNPKSLTIDSNVFAQGYKKETLYVPQGTKESYTLMFGDQFNNIEEMMVEKNLVYNIQDDVIHIITKIINNEETKVEIPSKIEIDGKEYVVRIITSDAFKDNKEIESVTIPAMVTEIGERAFAGCTGLKDIYVLAEEPISFTMAQVRSLIRKAESTTVSAFDGVDKDNCVLHVPYGTKLTYADAVGWKEFKNIVEMDNPSAINGLASNSDNAFDVYSVDGRKKCSSVTTLKNLSSGIYVIGGKKVLIK